MPEYDEFGIPIKGSEESEEIASAEVDEFGIPLKKKDFTQPTQEDTTPSTSDVQQSALKAFGQVSEDGSEPTPAQLLEFSKTDPYIAKKVAGVKPEEEEWILSALVVRT